ncbi:hypothetical protein ACN38_g11526 [Penicillium nordicum]|uniref:Secreted protein n=1 Tax=Penicillium nordicum TaxID=229535 RepID=A0A0M8NYN3_9EURO|nr:hypothetical protein ACN38_g11526 [Penicillium nordicum]
MKPVLFFFSLSLLVAFFENDHPGFRCRCHLTLCDRTVVSLFFFSPSPLAVSSYQYNCSLSLSLSLSLLLAFYQLYQP